MNMFRIGILVMLILISNPLYSQKSDGFLFMSKNEVENLSRKVGDLYFSYAGLRIDEFIIHGEYKFVTSTTRPNEVLIFGPHNTLYQTIKVKGIQKNEFAGLYKVNDKVFYAQRPTHKSSFEIYLDKSTWKKRKTKSQIIKNNRVYFSKSISVDDRDWSYFDSYGVSRGDARVKSAVLIEHQNEIDTLAMIPYLGGMNLLQPFSSWTFDIHYDSLSRNIIVQNFSNGLVSIYSKDGQLLNELDLKSFFDQKELKIGKSFIAGDYNYYSRVFTDHVSGELYLYSGGKSKESDSRGILLSWDRIENNWQEMKISNSKLVSYGEFPFVDVLEISDSYLYFGLNIKGKKEGVFRLLLENE